MQDDCQMRTALPSTGNRRHPAATKMIPVLPERG